MNRICLLLALGGLLGGASPRSSAGAPDNLLANPSFEQKIRDSGWSGLWEIDERISLRGQQSRTRLFMTDGRFGFKLLPNENNITEPSRLGYGIYQRLPAEELRGKSLLFEADMNAIGGAEAILRMIAVTEDNSFFTRVVEASTSGGVDDVPVPVHARDIFEVPDLPIKFLFLVCSVEGTSGVAYFDDVSVSASQSLSWQQGQFDPGPSLVAITGIDYHDVRRAIPRSLYGVNILYPYDGSGIWNPVYGLPNPQMVDLALDLGVSSLRFPGGGYSNFYHWKNGVGPVSSRPLTEIAPGRGVTGNNFGTDEALTFSSAIGVPLFVTVNADTGTAEEGGEWVKYANTAGRRVDYWEIGNELYFAPDPSDPTSGSSWQPTRYVERYLEFAQSMRAADPDIKLAADMEYNLGIRGCGVIDEGGCWADVLLGKAAGEIDYLALHSGLAPIIVGWDPGWDLRTVYASMLASPIRVKKLLDELSEKVDRLGGADAQRIRFAMTEWGPLFQSDPRSRFIDHSQTLGSALFVASLMKTMIEQPRMEIAHAFSFVDLWTSGWVGARDGQPVPKAPFFAFQLYSKYFGSELLGESTYSPTYDAHSVGLVGAVDDVPYLDLIASKNPGGDDLRVIGVNKHFDRPIRASFQVKGFAATGAEVRTLTGTAVDANTGTRLPEGLPEGLFAPQAVAEPDGRFLLGGPGEVTLDLSSVALSGSCFEYEFPAKSVTSLIITGVELERGTSQGCPNEEVELEETCQEGPFSPECSGLGY